MDRTLDFLVIGAQKSGTTALFHYLAAHPELFLPPGKELPFFSRNGAGAAELRGFLQDYYHAAPPGRLWGKVSPQYMSNPYAVTRIADCLPQARLIAILRHPVDRALSHYRMLKLRGRMNLSATQALEAALDPAALARARTLPSGAESEPDCLLAWGEYGRILGAFLEHFPRSQLQVLFQDELEQEPLQTLARLWDFLGVRRDFAPSNLGQRFHVGADRQRWPWLARASRHPMTRALTARIMSPSTRKALGFRLQQMNVQDAPSIPIALPAELRSRLIEHFRSDVQRLQHELDEVAPWTDFHEPRRQ